MENKTSASRFGAGLQVPPKSMIKQAHSPSLKSPGMKQAAKSIPGAGGAKSSLREGQQSSRKKIPLSATNGPSFLNNKLPQNYQKPEGASTQFRKSAGQASSLFKVGPSPNQFGQAYQKKHASRPPGQPDGGRRDIPSESASVTVFAHPSKNPLSNKQPKKDKSSKLYSQTNLDFKKLLSQSATTSQLVTPSMARRETSGKRSANDQPRLSAKPSQKKQTAQRAYHIIPKFENFPNNTKVRQKVIRTARPPNTSQPSTQLHPSFKQAVDRKNPAFATLPIDTFSCEAIPRESFKGSRESQLSQTHMEQAVTVTERPSRFGPHAEVAIVPTEQNEFLQDVSERQSQPMLRAIPMELIRKKSDVIKRNLNERQKMTFNPRASSLEKRSQQAQIRKPAARPMAPKNNNRSSHFISAKKEIGFQKAQLKQARATAPASVTRGGPHFPRHTPEPRQDAMQAGKYIRQVSAEHNSGSMMTPSCAHDTIEGQSSMKGRRSTLKKLYTDQQFDETLKKKFDLSQALADQKKVPPPSQFIISKAGFKASEGSVENPSKTAQGQLMSHRIGMMIQKTPSKFQCYEDIALETENLTKDHLSSRAPVEVLEQSNLLTVEEHSFGIGEPTESKNLQQSIRSGHPPLSRQQIRAQSFHSEGQQQQSLMNQSIPHIQESFQKLTLRQTIQRSQGSRNSYREDSSLNQSYNLNSSRLFGEQRTPGRAMKSRRGGDASGEVTKAVAEVEDRTPQAMQPGVLSKPKKRSLEKPTQPFTPAPQAKKHQQQSSIYHTNDGTEGRGEDFEIEREQALQKTNEKNEKKLLFEQKTKQATSDRLVVRAASVKTVAPQDLHLDLVVLDLSYNRIAQMPDRLCDLINLRILKLDENSLTTLPHRLGKLTQLEHLSVSSNHLRSIPTSIMIPGHCLKVLMVNDNQIQAIQSRLGNLTALEKLCLHGNPLVDLPSALYRLTNLKELSFDWLLYLFNDKVQSQTHILKGMTADFLQALEKEDAFEEASLREKHQERRKHQAVIGQILQFFKITQVMAVKEEYEKAQERNHYNPQSDDFDMPPREYATQQVMHTPPQYPKEINGLSRGGVTSKHRSGHQQGPFKDPLAGFQSAKVTFVKFLMFFYGIVSIDQLVLKSLVPSHQWKLCHIIAQQGHVYLLKDVLKQIDYYHNNCLTHLQAQGKDGADLRILQTQSQFLNASDRDFSTPLILAFYARKNPAQKAQLISELIEHPKTNLRACSLKFGTALHVALAGKETKVQALKILVSMAGLKDFYPSQDLNKVDEIGNTALHLLMKNFNTDPEFYSKVGKFMIRKGAILNFKNRACLTPLHYAFSFGQIEAIKFLVRFNQRARQRGGAIFDFTEQGGEFQFTPLHFTVYQNHFDLMSYLLKSGEPIDHACRDTTGRRAIDLCTSISAIFKALRREVLKQRNRDLASNAQYSLDHYKVPKPQINPKLLVEPGIEHGFVSLRHKKSNAGVNSVFGTIIDSSFKFGQRTQSVQPFANKFSTIGLPQPLSKTKNPMPQQVRHQHAFSSKPSVAPAEASDLYSKVKQLSMQSHKPNIANQQTQMLRKEDLRGVKQTSIHLEPQPGNLTNILRVNHMNLYQKDKQKMLTQRNTAEAVTIANTHSLTEAYTDLQSNEPAAEALRTQKIKSSGLSSSLNRKKSHDPRFRGDDLHSIDFGLKSINQIRREVEGSNMPGKSWFLNFQLLAANARRASSPSRKIISQQIMKIGRHSEGKEVHTGVDSKTASPSKGSNLSQSARDDSPVLTESDLELLRIEGEVENQRSARLRQQTEFIDIENIPDDDEFDFEITGDRMKQYSKQPLPIGRQTPPATLIVEKTDMSPACQLNFAEFQDSGQLVRFLLKGNGDHEERTSIEMLNSLDLLDRINDSLQGKPVGHFHPRSSAVDLDDLSDTVRRSMFTTQRRQMNPPQQKQQYDSVEGGIVLCTEDGQDGLAIESILNNERKATKQDISEHNSSDYDIAVSSDEGEEGLAKKGLQNQINVNSNPLLDNKKKRTLAATPPADSIEFDEEEEERGAEPIQMSVRPGTQKEEEARTIADPADLYGRNEALEDEAIPLKSASQMMVRPPLPDNHPIAKDSTKVFGNRKRQSYLNHEFNTQQTDRAMLHSRQASATFTSCKSDIKSERGFQSRLRVQKSSESKQVMASINFHQSKVNIPKAKITLIDPGQSDQEGQMSPNKEEQDIAINAASSNANSFNLLSARARDLSSYGTSKQGNPAHLVGSMKPAPPGSDEDDEHSDGIDSDNDSFGGENLAGTALIFSHTMKIKDPVLKELVMLLIKLSKGQRSEAVGLAGCLSMEFRIRQLTDLLVSFREQASEKANEFLRPPLDDDLRTEETTSESPAHTFKKDLMESLEILGHLPHAPSLGGSSAAVVRLAVYELSNLSGIL